MIRFVLDCSVTMAWCFHDELGPRAPRILAAMPDCQAVVPGHWSLEVANVLAIAERRNRIVAGRIPQFIEILNDLPIVIDGETASSAFAGILTLARTHRLTAYDAAYLELALRTGCPLASLDAALNGIATGLGVKLFSG
jgi:predicted nucleic acid-binding protein